LGTRPAAFPPASQEADSSKDAELIAGTTAHLLSQQQMQQSIAALSRHMDAKQRRLRALQGVVQGGEGLKAQYDNHLQVEGTQGATAVICAWAAAFRSTRGRAGALPRR
jgi:hypothetical protein